MVQKPVLLLFFANSQTRLLRNLTEERRRIKASLQSASIDIIGEGETSTEFLFETLLTKEYRNRVRILHFGGHANSDHIVLRKEDGNEESLSIYRIGELLSTLKGIQLVFLNGCATGRQVTQLLEAGVGSVIATNQPISDKKATDFSVKFYQALSGGSTISEAFSQAKVWANLESLSSTIIEKDKFESRDLYLNDSKEEESFPWGLFALDSSKSLDWTIRDLDDLPQTSVPVKQKITAVQSKSLKTRATVALMSIMGVALLLVGLGISGTWPFNLEHAQKEGIDCVDFDREPTKKDLLLFPVGDDPLSLQVTEKIQDVLISQGYDNLIDIGYDTRFKYDTINPKLNAQTQAPIVGKQCGVDMVVWGYPTGKDKGLINYKCLTLKNDFQDRAEVDLGLLLDRGQLEVVDIFSVVNYLVGMQLFFPSKSGSTDLEKALIQFYIAKDSVKSGISKGVLTQKGGYEQIDFMIASCLRKIGTQLIENCQINAGNDSLIKAVSFYKNALAINGNFKEAHHDLALVFWKLHENSKAKTHINKVVSILIQEGSQDSLLALANNTMAAIYLDSSPDSTIYFAKKALAFSSAETYPLGNLAAGYAALGLLNPADSLLNIYTRHHPADREGLYNKAILAHELGKSDEAISIFDSLSRAVPCRLDIKLGLADALYQSGNYSEAFSAYQGVTQQFPGNQLALRMMGTLSIRLGEHKETGNPFFSQIDNWGTVNSWLGLSRDLFWVNDFSKADWAMEKARGIWDGTNEEKAIYTFRHALILCENEQNDAAQAWVEELLLDAPENWRGPYLAAFIALNKGNETDMYTSLKLAIENNCPLNELTDEPPFSNLSSDEVFRDFIEKNFPQSHPQIKPST